MADVIGTDEGWDEVQRVFDKTTNPVLFNPDGMTVRQVKDCVDTLRWLYDSMDRLDILPEGDDRDAFVENLLHHIRQGREQQRKAWSR